MGLKSTGGENTYGDQPNVKTARRARNYLNERKNGGISRLKKKQEYESKTEGGRDGMRITVWGDG